MGRVSTELTRSRSSFSQILKHEFIFVTLARGVKEVQNSSYSWHINPPKIKSIKQHQFFICHDCMHWLGLVGQLFCSRWCWLKSLMLRALKLFHFLFQYLLLSPGLCPDLPVAVILYSGSPKFYGVSTVCQTVLSTRETAEEDLVLDKVKWLSS